ncbi:glycosyltransferase family 4 protein [Heliorestis acidaminivorans]|uniref:glycosyltransferase family 4 protein n=1 Tax=Heliorestis acidaminivorans TaxID=553427 RepID=UPI0014780EB8|nr:glycosyltransferase family 1 protein [Heliorestis acidaminivorans]
MVDTLRIGIDGRAAILYRGTGIGTYTYQLCKNLYSTAKKEKMRFFWPGDEYRNLEITDDATFRQVEQYRERFWEEVHIPQVIKQEKIDLYHVPQNGIGLPQVKQCPMVATIHDLIPYISPETVGKGYLKIFVEEMPRILETVERIIAPSHCTANDLIKIADVPKEKIQVIYEAAEPIYRPMNKEKAKRYIRERYGITRPYVLYIGGFSPRKNVRLLIQAFHLLNKELPQKVALVLPGKQSKEFNDLEVMVAARKMEEDVHFIGFLPVQEMPWIYNGADVFVYPSLYEGFGLPPLEAMACGVPTLVAHTSSLPEVVGDGALSFSPLKAERLCDLLYGLLTNVDTAQRLAQKGLDRAQLFSWRKAAEETWQVYRQVLRH